MIYIHNLNLNKKTLSNLINIILNKYHFKPIMEMK